MKVRVKESEAISWNSSGEIEFSLADLPPTEKNYSSLRIKTLIIIIMTAYNSLTFHSPLKSKSCHAAHFTCSENPFPMSIRQDGIGENLQQLVIQERQ